MDPAAARVRFASEPVCRLATIAAGGEPHLVPVTFALLGADTIVSAVDHKRKRTTALARLANIAARPEVALLADHYDEDWEKLWWVRADGVARVVEVGEAPGLLEGLLARYSHYRVRPPSGPLIVVEVRRWSGWSAGA